MVACLSIGRKVLRRWVGLVGLAALAACDAPVLSGGFLDTTRAVPVALEGESAGSVFAVRGGENRIGRAKECEIRIPSESLSRVQASIRAEFDALEITALHEREPVLVNGEPVRSGPLRDGDLLQIGSERFQIRRVTAN